MRLTESPDERRTTHLISSNSPGQYTVIGTSAFDQSALGAARRKFGTVSSDQIFELRAKQGKH
jgi:hypothetical protein